MNMETVRMVKIQDVPKKSGWAMHSMKKESQILFVDIFTLISNLFICGKSFRVDSRAHGDSFRVSITRDKNSYYEDTASFDFSEWQLRQILFAIEAFKKYSGLNDRVKILMMLRHHEEVKWSMLESILANCNLAELAETQVG